MAHSAEHDPVSLADSRAEDETLSDQQIHVLLQEAEARLRQNSVAVKPTSQKISTSLPTLQVHSGVQPYINSYNGAVRIDPTRMLNAPEVRLAEQARTVETKSALMQRKKEEKEATAGPNWFNLPKTDLTPELKRDLQLIKLRSVLDPKRFYKKENTKSGPPKYSQVGTIIESATEYFSARLTNKERKRTFVEEVLAGEKENHRFKTAYNKVQTVKTSGKKASYRVRKAKRSGRS